MFSLRPSTKAEIEIRIAAAQSSSPSGVRFLGAVDGRAATRVPFLFAHDESASVIGRGEEAFAAARRACERWSMFDLGWVRVANPEARIVLKQLVAVEAKTLGLWTLNVSRIVEVIETPYRFGFAYATTKLHVEEGEERFLLEFDLQTEAVIYKIEAVSRPRSGLARLGLPIARMFQHRFARDSYRRMQRAVCAATDTLKV